MAAWKIAPALATGNTSVLKVRSRLLLTRSFSLRFIFDGLPAFWDHTVNCTQTRRSYKRSWFPAWCRQHRQRLWYKHPLHFDQSFCWWRVRFFHKATPLGKLSGNILLLRRSLLPEAPSLVAKFWKRRRSLIWKSYHWNWAERALVWYLTTLILIKLSNGLPLESCVSLRLYSLTVHWLLLFSHLVPIWVRIIFYQLTLRHHTQWL